MKRILVCIVLIGAFANSLLAQQTRGMRPIDIQDEKGQRFRAYENSYALVIGINKYSDPKISPLNYAVQDAKEIAKLLEELEFPPENIRLLTNEEATLTRVKEEFAAMGDKTSREDRLLVYWAGHGETEMLPRGGELGYLIPHDGKRTAKYSTCLSMDEVKRLTERVAAKHVLFLVDACYGGISAVTSRSLARETELYLQKVTSAEALQIITAGTKDEQVVESSNWGHSAFAKAILDGFRTRVVDQNGDGIVTSDELFSYLKPRVFELSRSEAQAGKGHTPVMATLKPSEGQFTFVVNVPEFTLSVGNLPPRNSVFVNGKKTASDSATVKLRLKRGTYTLEVEAPGRERFSTIVDLSQDRELTPRMVSLLVNYLLETSPSGANVKIDGVEVGVTPIRKELTVGQHRIEITKDGYEPLSYVTNISEQNSIESKELKLLLYEITVITTPRGADIYLNDLPQEQKSPATLKVRPGSRYTVEVQHEGQKLSTSFQPAGSGAVSADFRSNTIQYAGPTVQPEVTKKEAKPEPPPIAKVTVLEISVDPPDAQVTIDGQAVKVSGGVARLEVKPGRRTIQVSRSGFEADKTAVDVALGETKQVNVRLVQSPPSSNTWLYIVGGVALAGGAAYFLLVKKPADSGGGSATDPYGNPPGFPGTP